MRRWDPDQQDPPAWKALAGSGLALIGFALYVLAMALAVVHL